MLLGRQWSTIGVATQAHPSVQNGGCPTLVKHSTARKAAVCITGGRGGGQRWWQVLPVDQIAAHCMAPDQAKSPFTLVYKVLVKPMCARKRAVMTSLMPSSQHVQACPARDAFLCTCMNTRYRHDFKPTDKMVRNGPKRASSGSAIAKPCVGTYK